MKQLIKLLSLSGLFIMSLLLTANAQNPKIGHINSQDILTLMPEIKTADEDLQKYGQQLESQLKTMSAEYQSKIQAFQNEPNMADAIKQTREKEIIDLQTRIQEFQETAQESIQKKKEELYSPILKKVENVIKEVAKDNNYTYILDTSYGLVLYFTDSNDISDLVKKKLGLASTSAAPVQQSK